MKEDVKVNFSNFSNANAMPENIEGIQKVMKDYKKVDKKVEKEDIKVPFLKKEERGFVFVEPSIIKLPSNGVCYKGRNDEDLDKGFIKIYPLTVREQEILSTPRYINDGVATCMVLNNCIASNICADELLEFDYNYLLFYLRKISISDTFKFKQVCPVCGEINIIDIKISDLVFDELPKDFKEPIKINFPQTKYTVLLRLPRVNDLRILKKRFSTDDSLNNITTGSIYLTRTLAIVSKDGKEVPKEEWENFYSSLPLKDFKELVDNTSQSSNIDKLSDSVKCTECGATIGGGIPITDDLFLF